jgi:predicted metallopeptidase
MSSIRTAVVVAVLLATIPASAASVAEETNLAILRDTIQSNKRALIAVNLGLTDEESERFWPVYERYQTALIAVHDRLLAVIERYTTKFADLSNEEALKIVDEYLTIEADRVAVRREHLGLVAAVLPGRKVARFYQIENKMDAVLRYDLAAEIPVIDP